MSNNRNTYQQVHNVSINKEKLLDIAAYSMLSKKDYRVLLVLFTELDGWSDTYSNRSKDPLNFKKVDAKTIAKTLELDKKDVKKAMDNLEEADIIESGSSDKVKGGYRFRF